MATARPSGTVTFLFTDIEGSTVLWDRFPVLMADALARHDELVLAAIDAWRGVVFASGGDGFAVAFRSASDAASAAVQAQRALAVEPFADDVRLRVRMGLHTGVAEERGGDYFGAAVSRAARVADVGRGGQIILSAVTAALLAGDAWVRTSDLGEHRLRGLERPERLYRLDADGLAVVDEPLRRGGEGLGNLPHRRARLVGREQGLQDLERLLVGGALVTVTGVGGVGKTRLALAAAAAAADRFADGVWVVELAQVVVPGDVAALTATVLQVQQALGTDGVPGVATALAGQRRLLILDNCEHVMSAAIELIEAIGVRCPDVAILATSREPFGVEGERILVVRPMDVDGIDGTSEAAQLFCERAAGVLGRFDPDADDMVVVDDICRRLDGLPLALELAAARLPTMSLQELDARLSDRFGLLTRRRGAVERQQSLRTTVAWSYDLLAEDERLLFERLSVFAGGFDREAADAVNGTTDGHRSVDDLIASLVDKSLLVAVRASSGTRFQLLETLRQFGEERLQARGASIVMRRRHLDHFLAWAEQADRGLKSPADLRWHRAFVAEWPNLRNAFSWAAELGDGDAACRLLCDVLWWAGTRLQMEVAEWAGLALAMPTTVDHPLRPVVAAGASFFTFMKGDLPGAQELIQLARDEEDRLGPAVEPFVPALATFPDGVVDPGTALADSMSVQRRAEAAGSVFWMLCGRLQEASILSFLITYTELTPEVAAAHLDRIRHIAHLADLDGDPSAIAHVCTALGSALRHIQPDEAIRLLERAVDMSVALDTELTANQARDQLASLYVSFGRHLDALELMGPTLRRHIQTGAWNQVWLSVLPILIPLARLGDPRIVVQILGALAHHADDHGISPTSREQLESELRAKLSTADFEQLDAAGRALTIAPLAAPLLQVIEDALA